MTAEWLERRCLAAVLGAGVAVRLAALAVVPSKNDAVGYVQLASDLSWLDPWAASFREPGWIMVVKVATGPFGYSIGALQVLGFLLSVAGLFGSVWALRQITGNPWLVTGGAAMIAASGHLASDAGTATREGVAIVAAVLLVGLAARAPRWLPILGAVMLAFRWELGMAVLATSVLLTIGRVIPVRRLAVAAAVAVVLMGPFLVNNAREYGDPMFHSNIHATFYANVEARGGGPKPPEEVPLAERLHPLIGSPNFRGPLVSWADYAQSLGARTVIEREAEAVVTLPAETLSLGWLPRLVGVLLAAAAVAGAWMRWDRMVLAVAVMLAVTLVGYGLALPWLSLRLVGASTLLLVALIVGGLDELTSSSRARPGSGASADDGRTPANTGS